MDELLEDPSIRSAVKAGDAKALAASLENERSEDIVDVLNRCDVASAAEVIQSLPREAAVDILDQPQLERVSAILSILPPGLAANMLDQMSDHLAADAIREMRVSVRSDLLKKVSPATKTSIEKLLPYSENSTGHVMTTEFVAVPADWSVAQVLAHIRAVEHARDTIYTIFIIDPPTGPLLRAASLRELIVANPQFNVLDVAPEIAPMTVTPDTPLDQTVRLISKYNLLAIPVVDADHHIVGIVTLDDAVDTLVEQQDAEVQRFGGMESLDAPYMRIKFPEMIKKRAGWLCVLFIAEMLTASAMQSFEDELQKAVVLALFIPLIMSSGGNSGSQATSLVIRALALQEIRVRDWWRVLMREIPSGMTLGAILGLLGAVRISVWQNFGIFDYGPHWKLLAFTIAAALVGIVTFGSSVGSMLPFIAKRLGFDPATASAPFVATLVDVTGIVIYFSIASLILRGTLL